MSNLVITVARKPLSESSVARNVLKHGTGGLNIDESRIAGTWLNPNPRQAEDFRGGNFAGGQGQGHLDRWKEQHSAGRWPANLILQHKPGCERVGTKKVKGSHDTTGVWGDKSKGITYNQSWHDTDQRSEGYTDSDGTETVDAWHCVKGCPVAELDEQGGERRSSGNYAVTSTSDGNWTVYGRGLGKSSPGYADKGGASRFFKQVKADE